LYGDGRAHIRQIEVDGLGLGRRRRAQVDAPVPAFYRQGKKGREEACWRGAA
jgi:hypothetical protein